MAHTYALVIAVEQYQSNKITPVRFAEADARAFADVLVELGAVIGPGDVVLSQQATKATIESRLRRFAGLAGPDDTLVLYYAGHGFSTADVNYITCYDTQLGDLANTSVQLQDPINALRHSPSKRAALFLDSCQSGLPADAAARALIDELRPEELERFLAGAEYTVCFASCKTDQSSYSEASLKHGVWTYHVLEALTGNAPTALVKGRYVTADSLQNYLAAEVPRTVRQKLTGMAQTPWFYGGRTHDFIVADVEPLLTKRAAAARAPISIATVGLRGTEKIGIKKLSGYDRRSHHVPDTPTPAAEAFAVRISQADLQDEIDTVYSGLQSQFRYKRRDVKTAMDDGRASVITPDFEFHVAIELDRSDPSQVVWRRELNSIADPDVVTTDAFDVVFEGMFDAVLTNLTANLNIAEFIDRVEQVDPEGVELEYPADASYCILHFSGSRGSIRVTENSIAYEVGYEKKPTDLIKAFVALAPRLRAVPAIKGLLPNGA